MLAHPCRRRRRRQRRPAGPIFAMVLRISMRAPLRVQNQQAQAPWGWVSGRSPLPRVGRRLWGLGTLLQSLFEIIQGCRIRPAAKWAPLNRPCKLPHRGLTPSCIAPAVLSATPWYPCTVCCKRRPARSARPSKLARPQQRLQLRRSRQQASRISQTQQLTRWPHSCRPAPSPARRPWPPLAASCA